MFPFWDVVISPLIEVLEPNRVVEIGALRGDTTAELLGALGTRAELHVIDPVPQFDPAEHERQFGGRYVFHRDLSLNALPTLGAFDLAIIDGDHNWYTVVNELRILQESATAVHSPGPVYVLHDVSWPYGRRDGYYAPDNVPVAFRQPNAKQGLVRGQSDLAATGGLNTHMWNALHEGGPRNGVLTALEDFVAEQRESFELTLIDLYTGLGVAVDRQRLAAQPGLAPFLGGLRSDHGRQRLVAECDKVAREALAAGALTLPAPPL